MRLVRLAGGKEVFEVARDLGVDPALVSRLERRRIAPSERTAQKIADHYGAPINRLLRDVTPDELLSL